MGRLARRWSAALVVLIGAGAAGACTTGDDAMPDTPTTTAVNVSADEIPVAHTPPGGWHGPMPAPVLARCTEPLTDGAPDLRGLWRVVRVETDDGDQPAHPALGHVQRIEQCGDRIVVTAGGVVHDMRADGTVEHGVDDVAERDFATRIQVVASYEDGVHVLRPVGIPVEVTRHRDGDELVWVYLGFTARLEYLGPPDTEPPTGEISP